MRARAQLPVDLSGMVMDGTLPSRVQVAQAQKLLAAASEWEAVHDCVNGRV